MTYEKKRKMAEHPSRYSAADKALYRLSMCDEEMQQLGETIESEREKLQKRIKELEEAIRQHQKRDWSEKSPPYSDWDEELYALLGGQS